MLWDDLAEQGYVTAAAFPFGDLWGAAYWNSTFHHLAPSKYGARGSSFADHDQVLESWERGEPFCVGASTCFPLNQMDGSSLQQILPRVLQEGSSPRTSMPSG